MSGPSFHVGSPPAHFFKFPPTPEPYALAPPTDEGSLRSPFAIDATLYNKVLSPYVPITFALVYVCTITALNRVNHHRGFKPWAISKSPLFSLFVILHNVGLAVYSGITCYAMIRALSVSWPGLFSEAGVPGALDALCKMNGPRGLGDAITYNSTSSLWSSKNHLIHLGDDGILPDSTDVGRIWNEGLAFWGWFFYLSKFYEVVDTAIIILKGKRSHTLQTYHHAGAMLCMWAGIRYMSPPIWMFVLVNSGIHTVMYTYYTLTALGMKIGNNIKRIITTMQIVQFLVGASFAAAHLFVSYSVPVALPYTVVSAVETIVSEISAAASAVTEDPAAAFATVTSSVAAAVATATMDLDKHAWFKKLAFRAAGFEGLAEAVRDKHGETFGLEHDTRPLKDALRRIEKPKFIEEIKYRTEYQEVHCLDTDGQAFAILLNVLYLTPLTLLFLRFFVKTYIWGTTSKGVKKSRTASDAAVIAAKQTSRFFEHLGKEAEGAIDEAIQDIDSEFGVKEKAKEFKQEVEDATKDWSVDDAIARIRQDFSDARHSPEVEDLLEKLQTAYAKTTSNLHVKEIIQTLEEKASQAVSDISGEATLVKNEAMEDIISTPRKMTESVRITREVDEAMMRKVDEDLERELDAALASPKSAQKTGGHVERQKEEIELKIHEYESGGESSRSELNASPTKSSKIPTKTNSKKHKSHGHHHGHTPGQGSPTSKLSYAEATDPMLPSGSLHKA